MKEFYFLLLMIGCGLALVMQVVTIAVPQDASVASALSSRPNEWSLILDDDLRSASGRNDAKEQVVVALRNRASFVREIYSRSFWTGTVLIALAVIGLIREREIDRLRKLVD